MSSTISRAGRGLARRRIQSRARGGRRRRPGKLERRAVPGGAPFIRRTRGRRRESVGHVLDARQRANCGDRFRARRFVESQAFDAQVATARQDFCRQPQIFAQDFVSAGGQSFLEPGRLDVNRREPQSGRRRETQPCHAGPTHRLPRFRLSRVQFSAKSGQAGAVFEKRNGLPARRAPFAKDAAFAACHSFIGRAYLPATRSNQGASAGDVAERLKAAVC